MVKRVVKATRVMRAPGAQWGSVPQRSDEEQIQWLLEFLRRDVATLRPGELLDLRDDAYGFIDWNTVAGVSMDGTAATALLEGRPDRPVTGATSETLSQLQAGIRRGVEALERTGRWVLFAQDAPPRWVIDKRADGTLARLYTGDFPVVWLASAWDVLLRWWPQLRRCQYAECGALFLPRHGRQRYHDARCSWRARWGKFTATRDRDYHQEYTRRVKRHTGANVTPQRRHQRKGKSR